MKSVRVNLGLLCSLLLLALPLFAGTAKEQPPAKTAPTMAISVTLLDGSSEVLPVQDNVSSVIPTPGAKGVFGVELKPYMSGQNVAVHISAVTGDSWTDSQGPTLQTAKTTGTRALGSYVIGKTGDSIQLADLAEFGLPSVSLKIVGAELATKSCPGDADGCIICSNGLECCFTTLQQREECFKACGSGLKSAAKK